MSNKVLVVGTLPNSNPKSIGGVNIIIQNVVNFLTERKIDFDFLHARRTWIKYGLLPDSFLTVPRLLFKIPKYDIISIHATRDITILIAPVIVSFAHAMGKKVIYHVQAGNFHKTFEKLPSFYQKTLIEQVFNKSTIVFFETNILINFFKGRISSKVGWLPNTRKRTSSSIKANRYQKRFTFISRVTKTKGILVAIEAFSKLSSDYLLDVYGPIGDDCKELFKNPHKNVTYKGLVDSNEVPNILRTYDYLILPTFHTGEGYPGIILEALEVGTPIITTNWNAIPEIVIHDFNGKLVQPNDVNALHHSILTLTEEEYPALSKNAFESFEKFDRDLVYKKLIDAYTNS